MLPELVLQIDDALVAPQGDNNPSRSLICIGERRDAYRFFNDGDLFWLTKRSVSGILENGGMIIRGDE